MADSAAASPRGSAPTPRSRLIGREMELAVAQVLLLDETVPLLTLTGPGGVGKTRLATALVQNLVGYFDDGMVWVDLAPVGDPALVLPTIAHVLGVRDSGDQPVVEGLLGFLRPRSLLLILDNFEHLLPAAPHLSALLAGCVRLKMLVTSRSVLSLSGEHTLPIPPLRLPPPGEASSFDAVASSEAVRLFIERARTVRPDFTLTDANASVAGAICRRLDGLPLAIELAASRMRHLPLPSLLVRLEAHLPLLTGGARDMPARLRTMRAAIAWSYDLLTPEEQALFRRLVIFVGGFTVPATEAIGSAAQDPAIDIFEGLASLTDKSLLQQELSDDREPRFLMLETVREFGLEQLEAQGEDEETRDAHAAYFLALAEQAAPELMGPQQATCLARLQTEYPNLREALARYEERGDIECGLRLCAALWYFWFIRGYNREGRSWLARTLGRPHRWSAAHRAALHGASMLASNQGDFRQAASYADELLALAQHHDDLEGVARALFLRSFAATYQGDRTRALRLAEEALALFRRLKDPHWIGIGLNRLAIECHIQGHYARARSLYEESLGIWQARGDTWGVSFVTTNLGVTAQAQGDLPRAAGLYRESLAQLLALGETWGDDELLPLVADLAAANGQHEQAARLIGALDGLLASIGYALPPFVHVFHERAQAAARRGLGEPQFASAVEEGRRLPPAQAIRLAQEVVSVLADAPPGGAASTSPLHHGLTPRELEVLRLVAAGHSNREIAEALFISVPTVKRHLTNVMGKLALPSRSALNTYAHAHNLD